MVEYSERLKAAMDRAQMKTRALSDAIGMSYQGVKKVIDGKSNAFSAENNSRAAAILGVSPDWLATGKGAMLPTPSSALEGAPVRALAEGEDPGDGYVQIPEYEVRFAAGNGRTALFDEIEGTKPRTYRVEWFAAAGINPAYAKCFKVHGDSMEPMLFDGDSVLVNLAETGIMNGRVYALRYGNELRIKRCYKRLDGGLVLRSDNPSFLPRDEEISAEVAAEHISILGRVRDKSGSGGL